MRRSLLCSWAFAVFATTASAVPPVIESVSLSAATMNPTLGDSVQVTVNLSRAGNISVLVVDRDGFPVRTLAANGAVAAGVTRFRWDGRDDSGAVVPDEAFSFRIDWSAGTERATYFPADVPAAMTSIDADYYTVRTATLSYTLPVPSRVHVQAGTARSDPKTGELHGPVMKTIVNREPRAAGKIAEPWNGLDESGTIRVADLRDFVIAIAVTPLPENSVITYGKRSPTFAEAAVRRTGKSLFTHKASSHAHHAGLSVLDDVSPSLKIEPVNASWSEAERAWKVTGPVLKLRIAPAGPSAADFARHPGELYAFVNGAEASRRPRPSAYPAEVQIPLPKGGDPATVTMNWRSEYGAVAANSIVVQRDAQPAKGGAAGASR